MTVQVGERGHHLCQDEARGVEVRRHVPSLGVAQHLGQPRAGNSRRHDGKPRPCPGPALDPAHRRDGGVRTPPAGRRARPARARWTSPPPAQDRGPASRSRHRRARKTATAGQFHPRNRAFPRRSSLLSGLGDPSERTAAGRLPGCHARPKPWVPALVATKRPRNWTVAPDLLSWLGPRPHDFDGYDRNV